MDSKKNAENNDNAEKSDLLDIYFFRNLIKNRFFRPAVNILFFIALLIIIYFGLSSEPDLRFHGGIPFATTMIWDIWHPLLVFTLIIFGRLWCFACPIGAVGDWTQSVYSVKKKYPEKYRNLWIAVIFFLFIFAAERHLFMFTRNPPNTAYLLLFFTGLAILMGFIYEKRSFCRYICPIGLVLGLFSMLSATELRCKSRKTCQDHDIKECVIGNEAGKACPVSESPQTMERNNQCIMCMECVKSCSKDNIRISPRLPGADVVNMKKTHLDEAYLVHGIIVIFLFVLGMERLQFRNIIINFVKSTLPINSITFLDLYWRNMWAIIIFAAITLGAAGLMYLSAKMSFSEKNTKQKFIELSYAFLPLSLSVYLAENTFRLLKGLFYIAGVIGQLFGKVWEFAVDFDAIDHMQIALLSAGFIFTIWAGYLISKKVSNNEHELKQGMIALGIVAVVYLGIGVRILTLPIV
ncbi:MAG: 4Fe-4S binding protein [Candidatus Methanoperedens sp.]|nr:4Fe-4S binding protein [Candidatus Methanoperedens sp.]MCZ7403566.1 4Fe-4S binding protein [Candidatus Methanoperedens sp.]